MATEISGEGEVVFIVLATGEADRTALSAELAAAEAKATDLVNQARAEAGLPPVSLDPTLAEAARKWLAEASRRGCYVGFNDPSGCPGPDPDGADRWWVHHSVWDGAESALNFYVAPAEPGDDQLKLAPSGAEEDG